MAKVFLSHSSSDKELVRKIAQGLGKYQCIYDEFTFEVGKKTLDEIFIGLEKTDIFVLFISDAALNSEWVQKEINIAYDNISRNNISRILPIIIDKSITHNDLRIPSWISRPYNLKVLTSEVIILKKIRQCLREVLLNNNLEARQADEIFIGRNKEMEIFENKINNFENITPSCIVVSNYFEGIGRRTFLKYALKKSNFIDGLYEPFIVEMSEKESIENFIYKINRIAEDENILNYDFTDETVASKIDIAKKLIVDFLKYKEIIFIIDEGSIILPNGFIVDWFNELITKKEFNNTLSLCVISKYKPRNNRIQFSEMLIVPIPELTSSESKNLFAKLLSIYKLEAISLEDKKLFLDNINGVPGQIKFAVNLISQDLLEAKKCLHDIREYSDTFASTLLNIVKNENELAYQVLILLSESDIISMELIDKVFDENAIDCISYLRDLSICHPVFYNYEYIKLNSIIADFVSRSKIKLDGKYKIKLDSILKDLLNQNLDEVLRNDYSEFMLTIQQMLQDRITIPKKYFIPSLILKNIIKEYYKGNYEYVIEVCLKLLENNKYDFQIIWETKYRLTMAYARTNNEQFFEHIDFFNNQVNKLDYFFLLGFYYRNNNNFERSMEYYNEALKIYPAHPRSQRELVSLYLSQGMYTEALDIAKSNYEKNKTNIYHIQSYFSCLLKKSYTVSIVDMKLASNLLQLIKDSVDVKAADMYPCMLGEYKFYAEKNFTEAIKILQEAIRSNNNKVYPMKSLLEMYKKRDMTDAYNKLELELSKLKKY